MEPNTFRASNQLTLNYSKFTVSMSIHRSAMLNTRTRLLAHTHTQECRHSHLTKCYWDKHFPSSHLVLSPSKSAAQLALTAYLLARPLTDFSVQQHKFHSIKLEFQMEAFQIHSRSAYHMKACDVTCRGDWP